MDVHCLGFNLALVLQHHCEEGLYQCYRCVNEDTESFRHLNLCVGRAKVA